MHDTAQQVDIEQRTVFQKTVASINTEMMAARWKVFDFFHQIPEAEQQTVPPCPKCFSSLTLLGEL